MHPALLEIGMTDPEDGTPLTWEAGGEPGEGILRAASGRVWRVKAGIPRLVPGVDPLQANTRDGFAFKWQKTDTYDGAGIRASTTAWYLQKYGFATMREWASEYQGLRVLDVGCGSGFSSRLWLEACDWRVGSAYVGVDISAAVDVARDRIGRLDHVALVQADALRLPFPDASFDVVFSEGVLHHTPSTQAAIAAAARTLKPGGHFDFYVYKVKAPMREWADDYIRVCIAGMNDETAWNEMRSLTVFARTLSGLKCQMVLDEPVPLLGLPAGSSDLQRFIYNHFAKLFWNDSFSFEENVHVNFDWYRPAYAHRQTPEQVRSWCDIAGLDITRLHVDDSGITVRALRRG